MPISNSLVASCSREGFRCATALLPKLFHRRTSVLPAGIVSRLPRQIKAASRFLKQTGRQTAGKPSTKHMKVGTPADMRIKPAFPCRRNWWNYLTRHRCFPEWPVATTKVFDRGRWHAGLEVTCARPALFEFTGSSHTRWHGTSRRRQRRPVRAESGAGRVRGWLCSNQTTFCAGPCARRRAWPAALCR